MPQRRKSAWAAEPAQPSPALTLAELDATLAAIGGFEARPRLAIGVSGGPDSLALVILADRWARERGGEALALIVDHGLRPESAAEARTVAGWLAARGIPHDILAWRGDKPASGIQKRAREARYGLLAGWCRGNGVLHLLAAHHREDQGETHLIRRRAQSGIDGLAGMSAVRELPGCRLVRPLLAVPRTRLAALLADESQPCLRDPSNQNPAFERARLRLGTIADEVIDEARACGALRIERERALDDLLARAVALHPAGFAVIDSAIFGRADADSIERLLGRVAACVGGAHYPPRRERLARLRAGMAAQPERARTLGGCCFVPWRGRILVLRELAAAGEPIRLDAGASAMWDRRFAASLPPTATGGLTLGYLGQLGTPPTQRDQDRDKHCLPRLLYPVLPAWRDDAGFVVAPHLTACRVDAAVLPLLSIQPANPLSSAGFTVV